MVLSMKRTFFWISLSIALAGTQVKAFGDEKSSFVDDPDSAEKFRLEDPEVKLNGQRQPDTVTPLAPVVRMKLPRLQPATFKTLPPLQVKSLFWHKIDYADYFTEIGDSFLDNNFLVVGKLPVTRGKHLEVLKMHKISNILMISSEPPSFSAKTLLKHGMSAVWINSADWDSGNAWKSTDIEKFSLKKYLMALQYLDVIKRNKEKVYLMGDQGSMSHINVLVGHFMLEYDLTYDRAKFNVETGLRLKLGRNPQPIVKSLETSQNRIRKESITDPLWKQGRESPIKINDCQQFRFIEGKSYTDIQMNECTSFIKGTRAFMEVESKNWTPSSKDIGKKENDVQGDEQITSYD